ncbi:MULTISPECIES: RimK family protein [unclassified Marichromatium]|uniref:RimK family protein n=1 Tax=unclassified Marichromatium TaxID=2618417 RepID=UPI000F4104CA|nr:MULTISPECIES: RimK family protein [unclassified Marichromatium]RNE90498.1 RimK family alpha-L-glutamate ligase [Marichromatium sp. AB32]RNE91849.1 RimK family alpha-L-glutamate ligase [Marichromatium sp. AB31]
MAEHLLVVERPAAWAGRMPGVAVVDVRDYLAGGEHAARRGLRVINLCDSYRYRSLGYYCSLLAEARGHRVLPSVATIQELSSRALYALATEELDIRVQRLLGARRSAAPIGAETHVLTLYFGHCEAEALRALGRRIFETFPCPILRVTFRRQGEWRISAIEALPTSSLPDEPARAALLAALGAHLSRRWRRPRAPHPYRYDLAVLRDPEEELAPSDPGALARLVRAGRALGVNVELIGRRDYSRLAEYDALFIRETTRIAHHTFRFAKKAEREGLVVIDDPRSILRCTNKVYLAELLAAHRVPRPRTLVLRRETLLEAEREIGYPVVLKIPEGSFSRGVFKAEDRAALRRIGARLLRASDLILAQEYLYTPFDWRIGVLGREPLYACKYFMSRDHWQIVKHGVDGGCEEGGFETLALEAVPPAVLRVALRAAEPIGDGLYGVDIKETSRGPVVIEVNDNPSIDAGVEDAVLGDALYRRLIEFFVCRLDRQRQRGEPRRAKGA